MRRAAAVAVVSLLVVSGSRPAAQSLTFSLFERYLEALRQQAGIPGMTALVLQDGAIAWGRGFGRADVERNIEPTLVTPYAIGGLSQTIGATLLLKKCVDERLASPDDPVTIWNPFFPEPATTLAHLLAHVTPAGGYRFDLTRFAALTTVVEACSAVPYAQLVAEEIFSRLGLADSVPGAALAVPTIADVDMFGTNNLARYAAVVNRVATPYRVDFRGRATRTDVPLSRANAATGLVSTALDLAKLDATLRYDRLIGAASTTQPILLAPHTLARAWTPVAFGFPAALGWFVQSYNSVPVVWQFGAGDGYSSLLVKLPTRGVTFILLANSEGLNAPSTLERGDVTASVFARTFLRVYVP